jgi:hypothetical protein
MALALTAGPTSSAYAAGTSQTITVTAFNRGYITSSNAGYIPSATANYLVGSYNSDEYRNFYQFNLPTILGTITHADVVIGTEGVGLHQYSPLIYSITTNNNSLSFKNLGNGTFLGSQSYIPTDYTSVKTIALDPYQLSLAILPGSALTLSGRVTSPTNFGAAAPEEIIFGGSQGNGVFGKAKIQLDLTILTVPESSQQMLTLIGLALICLIRTKCRNRADERESQVLSFALGTMK